RASRRPWISAEDRVRNQHVRRMSARANHQVCAMKTLPKRDGFKLEHVRQRPAVKIAKGFAIDRYIRLVKEVELGRPQTRTATPQAGVATRQAASLTLAREA